MAALLARLTCLRRMGRCLAWLACGLSVTLLSPFAQAVEKHALVIGNASYLDQPLANTHNDAMDISTALKGLGFEIYGGGPQLDLGLGELDDQFYAFAEDLPNGSVALLYYAGHGAYALKDTWLIPVDAVIKRERQVKRSALALSDIMDELREVNPRGLNLLFLDACRNNPFGNGYRSSTRGLVRPNSVPSGTFVGLAADQGEVAADGDGRNGLYTKHLLAALQQHPHIEIGSLHRRIARGVYGESRYSAHPQRPVFQTNILDDFCFDGCASDIAVQRQMLAEQAAAERRRIAAEAAEAARVLGAASEAEEERQRAEVERLAAEQRAAEKLIEEQRKARRLAAEQERLETERVAELKRKAAQEALAADKQRYLKSIGQRVLAKWESPSADIGDWSCTLRMRQIPGGEIIDVQTVDCTGGGAALEKSLERAVLRSSPLPAVPDPRLFDHAVEITLSQEAPVIRTGQLWVKTSPSDAQVRIMNITPKYKDGIELKQGKSYDIFVTKQGYDAWRQWVDLSGKKIELMAELNKKQRKPFEPEMVAIPAGSFRMGCLSADDDCSDDEKPVHQVSVPAFKLAKTEVTFAQYDVYAKVAKVSLPNDRGWGRGNRPVINVSWEDAQAYVRWLNRQTGKNYRLPSGAEWEYAARAGSSTKYSWGDRVGNNRANCDGCDSRWDNEQAAPAASFTANRWGLHDMHGNVWEWVEDKWHMGYQGGPTDGSAWVSGLGSRRVLRGGGWNYGPRYLRSAYRTSYGSRHYDDNVSFRLAESE